ncbi:multidrug effflux MFS transporter [Dongshaea marina]|uniref:multidrug effflux MFS transporter n=1 Tax=Dongshaea marina TaxID=2047966 RepID=UPI00131F0450|nr:multidrug effflux MFS transporter [Dongshaea marina]
MVPISKNVSSSLIAILISLVLFSPMGIDIYIPSMPQIGDYFGASPQAVTYTINLFVFSLGLGQILIGPLADYFGRRKVALAGITLYLICSASAGLIHSIEGLLLLRTLQGLGACCTSIVCFSVVRDCCTPEQSSRLYSQLNGALNIAPAIAPMLGGLLASHFGWHSNFYALAAYALLILTFVFFKLPETRPGQPKFKEVYHFSAYLGILKNPLFAFYSCCCMGAMAIIITYVTLAPGVLITRVGLSQVQFALLVGSNALGIIFFSFMAPFVINHFGRQKCVQAGAGLLLFAGVCMQLLINHAGISCLSFMLPVCIASAGFATLLGAATSFALEPFSHNAGTASALLGCIQMMGASLFSIAINSASNYSYWLLAVMMLAWGIFTLYGSYCHSRLSTPLQRTPLAS